MMFGGGGGGRGGAMMKRKEAAAPAPPMPSFAMARSSAAAPMQEQASKMDSAWGGDDDADEEAEKEEAFGGEEDSEGGGDDDGDVADMDLRAAAHDRALYRPLDKTEEYAETHYWRVRSEEDCASLVTPNEFWADFASYCARIGTASGAAAAAGGAAGAASDAAMEAMAAAIAASPFVSAHVGVVAARGLPTRLPVGEAGAAAAPSSGRFALNQMLLALAVIGLPFECAPAALPRPAAPAVTALPGGAGLRFASAGTPLIVFHQDLSQAAVPGAGGAAAAGAGGAAGAAAAGGAENGILCGQSYFDPRERSEVIRGVSREKYLPFAAAGADGVRAVSMLRGKVYGCSAVITNVGSVSQAIDVLLHLPQGAVPVQGSKVLRTHSLRLSPYSTQRFEYTFTLPRAGTFDHYPVHVSRAAGEDGEGGAGGAPVLLAFAAPTRIAAVEDSAVGIDRSSWLWISQMGTLDEVLAFMRNPATNLASLELHRILWRCGEGKETWTAIVDLLRSRHHFNEGVWAYGIAHGDSRAVTELLAFDSVRSRIAEALGPFPVIAAPLLRTAAEPFVGGDAASASGRTLYPRSNHQSVWSGALRSGQLFQAAYEHLEYSPLVNARAHVLGERREILNEAVLTRYRTLITVLAAKAGGDITAADRLAVVYHLLLQDRVNEARAVFAAVPAPADSVAARPAAAAGAGAGAAAAGGEAAAAGADGSWMTLQYDYCAAYLDLLAGPVEEEDPAAAAAAFPLAAAVATAYAAYPVPKWAAKFAEVGELVAQVRAMAAGGAAAPGAAAAAIGSGSSHDETGTSKELSRERQAARGAALEPTLSLRTRGANVVIAHANLPKAALSFYGMDLEPLFSTAAFSIAASSASGASRAPAASPSSTSGSAGGLGQFAFVRPNRSMPVALTAAGGSGSAAAAGGAGAGAAAAADASAAAAAAAAGGVVETVVPLPADLAKRNMLVVASSGGVRASTPYFANDIAVTVAEAFGRLRVTHASTGAPLPRVYVKVFWRESASDSKGKFYKDGYTSSSGAFDYAALSTDELSRTQRFAILVLSEEHGSVVLTAAPPKA